MLNFIFNFHGHISRREYLIVSGLAFCLYVIAFTLDRMNTNQLSESQRNTVTIILVSFLFTSLYLYIVASIRRLRDIGVSPFWSILALIPFAQIVLFLYCAAAEGWGGKNRGKNFGSLLAAIKILAECDKPINKHELIVFREICEQNIPPELRNYAQQQFENGPRNPLINYPQHLKAFATANGYDVALLQAAMAALFHMANADGNISKPEGVLLDLAEKTWGLQEILPPGFEYLIGMTAKLAKADGIVSPEEIAVLTHFFDDVANLTPSQRKIAIDKFGEAKNSTTPFSQYADSFVEFHADNPGLREGSFQLLVELALADDEITPEEQDLLEEAATILGIDGFHAQNEGASRQTQEHKGEAYHARVLGLEPGYTFDVIKSRYKQLIRKNHPDKVAQLSEAIQQAAENETKKVNEAYAYFKSKYAGA